jgi:hypothetical protein
MPMRLILQRTPFAVAIANLFVPLHFNKNANLLYITLAL